MQTIKILGVRVSALTKKALLARIEKALNQPAPLWIVTANPEILLKARRDTDYRAILNQADIVIADGIGVVLAARLLYGARLERITGADLAEEVLRLALHRHKKIFLLGGSAEANKKARERFTIHEAGFTKVKGIGGDFDENEVIHAIKEFQPAALLVALGAPKQEQFIHHLLETKNLKLKTTLMMGIGGTIDFWARPSLRAPKFIQRIGLEWLWRLMRQPWRIKRLANAAFIFPLMCLYDFFNQKTLP